MAALSACTDQTPSFNPTPAPTRPGQVVVIAGSPDNFAPPRDGEYAIRSSAQSDGGLAVDPATGSIYVRVFSGREKVIERIERDGTITTLRVKNPGDQLAISSGTLWIMSSGKELQLSRMSLSDLQEERVLHGDEGRAVQIEDASGRRLDPKQLNKSWDSARFTIRGDGVPIIVASTGALFEVPGDATLRAWEPEGYEAALRKVAGKDDLHPTDVVAYGHRGLMVLGPRGLIRIPADGTANAARFPATTRSLPPWTAVTPLRDGSALLLGGTSAFQRRPRPLLVRPDGRLELLPFGGPKWCDQFDGTLAAVASAEPGGLARMPNGDYVLSDKNCGRIYRFRLPTTLNGTASSLHQQPEPVPSTAFIAA